MKKGRLLILIFSLLFSNCTQIRNFPVIGDIINVFFPVQEFHPCDPFQNYYEGRKHYISDEYVKDNGRLDYEKLLTQQREVHHSKCDPLYGK